MAREARTRQQRRRDERGRRPQRWLLALAAGAIVVTLGIVMVAADGGGSSSDEAERPPAPQLVMEGFDGEPVAISDLRGRPAVVNFWASWCTPCLAELPGFERVYQEHRDDVRFLGINLADDPEASTAVVVQTGITYPLARDPEGEAFIAFGGLGMPTTVFLDADGRMVELFTGELTAGQLADRIATYFERS